MLRREHIQTYAPLVVLAALVLSIGLYDQTFFSVSNLLTVAADTMTLFLIASGVTFVIMIGGIDLSIQSVASMASCLLAVGLPRFGLAAVPLAILGGSAAGMMGGLVSTKLRIPSFITTLAVSGVVTSVGYWVSAERSINISVDDSARDLGWAVGEIVGVPNEIWLGLVCLAILSALLGLTPFGRLVRGIGSQEQAVMASGIDVNRTKIAAWRGHGGALGIGIADARQRVSPARHFLHRRRRYGDHRRRRLDLANLCWRVDRSGCQDRHDFRWRQRFCATDRLRLHSGGGCGDHDGS